MSHVEPPDFFLLPSPWKRPAQPQRRGKCCNTGFNQAPHDLGDGPDRRLLCSAAFQPYKQELQLWLQPDCPGKPGGYSPGPQDLDVSPPPGSTCTPTQPSAPPPAPGSLVLPGQLPRVFSHSPTSEPSLTLLPRLLSPAVLIPDVGIVLSLFFVHLSVVIVVLTPIAFRPVPPLFKTLPRRSPTLNLSSAKRTVNPSLSPSPRSATGLPNPSTHLPYPGSRTLPRLRSSKTAPAPSRLLPLCSTFTLVLPLYLLPKTQLEPRSHF